MVAFQVDDEEEQTQRRSKAEMACDLMLAISRGSVRPTKIMQRANLTWNALLAYLNVLAINGLVRRVEKGNSATYHLTDKGQATMKSYVQLREQLRPLKLAKVNTRAAVSSVAIAVKALRTPVPDREAFAAGLKTRGYAILEPSVKGRSGVTHHFSVVARDASGATHGFVLSAEPDEKLILGLFVTQLDTSLKLHVVHRGEPTARAKERAKEYGIELVKMDEKALLPKKAS